MVQERAGSQSRGEEGHILYRIASDQAARQIQGDLGRQRQPRQTARGGDYTITVEAAREHGTYQSMRKQVALSNKPFTEDLKGNVEIRSASIEYRRKAAAK